MTVALARRGAGIDDGLMAVATGGSEAQKAAFRRAVNKAHAQVYSTSGSPVQYNAFDEDLQVWVAACL